MIFFNSARELDKVSKCFMESFTERVTHFWCKLITIVVVVGGGGGGGGGGDDEKGKERKREREEEEEPVIMNALRSVRNAG